MDDYGLDMDEVTRVIDAADVLVVRFAIVDKRLLVDSRTSETEGPLIALVPKAGSVEERFKSLKKLRPRFPLPEKIMSFMWPRHIDTLQNSGVWDKIARRLVSLGGEEMTSRCDEVFQQLALEEKTEVLQAIRGGEGYQSLWERAG
ncbi:MAG TPA: hypothetical protein VLS25_03675 [Dehalococcoidia bacterium]|nr:hypothetical protein [Dehalococcoidia bacterium]